MPLHSEQPHVAPHDRLRAGVQRFRETIFEPHRDDYQRVAREPQRPHTLMITCADSRVDPETLTQSSPGEIFVARNIGNLVPAYGEMIGGVSAVIEYAVSALAVSQIVICGHSDCGAMKALLDRSSVAAMPTVSRWLRNGETALAIVRARFPDASPEQLLAKLVEQNVLLQLDHLRTHPSVAGRMATGALSLCGWCYDIGEGAVAEYHPENGSFSPL